MTMPYTTLSKKGLKTPETLLEIPGQDQHPVLLARHMLLLASFLQRKQISIIVFTLFGNCISQSVDSSRSASRDSLELQLIRGAIT